MKVVTGFPLYFADEQGSVFSNYKGALKELSAGVGTTGYYLVILCRNGERHTKKVHRIIAETFLPNPKSLRVVNHINGDKLDNRVENLEWCSQKQNMKHAREKLGFDNRSMLGKSGGSHNRSKSVEQLDLGGNVVAVFGSGHEATRETGVCNRGICLVCKGKRVTAGGFKWRYADA